MTFLRDCASRTIVLGEFDCGLWLADWYMVATGRPDPVAEYRGRGLKHVGHPVRLMTKRFGLQRTWSPTTGDIGLVRVGGLCVGAIYARSWMVLNVNGGVGSLQFEPRFIAWSMR